MTETLTNEDNTYKAAALFTHCFLYLGGFTVLMKGALTFCCLEGQLQPTLLSGGMTRENKNMLSPLECIRLHDKPLSFSSASRATWNARWEPRTTARSGHVFAKLTCKFWRRRDTTKVLFFCLHCCIWTEWSCGRVGHNRVHTGWIWTAEQLALDIHEGT